MTTVSQLALDIQPTAPVEPTDPRQAAILCRLRRNRGELVTRDALVEWVRTVGLGIGRRGKPLSWDSIDRENRDAIMELRRSGHHVVLMDPRGYALATSLEQRKRLIAEYDSRIAEQSKTAAALRRSLYWADESAEGQAA